jgi:hypothetical protein
MTLRHWLCAGGISFGEDHRILRSPDSTHFIAAQITGLAAPIDLARQHDEGAAALHAWMADDLVDHCIQVFQPGRLEQQEEIALAADGEAELDLGQLGQTPNHDALLALGQREQCDGLGISVRT